MYYCVYVRNVCNVCISVSNKCMDVYVFPGVCMYAMHVIYVYINVCVVYVCSVCSVCMYVCM